MSRSTNNADACHAAPTRPPKVGFTEAPQAENGCRRSPMPSKRATTTAFGTATTTTSDSTASTSPIVATHIDANGQMTSAGPRQMDPQDRPHEPQRTFIQSSQAMRGASSRVTSVPHNTPNRMDSAAHQQQPDTHDQTPSSSGDLFPTTANPTSAELGRPGSRQSVNSDAIGSTVYLSLNSSAFPATSPDDLSAMDIGTAVPATADPRRPPHTPLPNSDWPLDIVASGGCPLLSSSPAAAAATATTPTNVATRRRTEEYQRDLFEPDNTRRVPQRRIHAPFSGMQVPLGVASAGGGGGGTFTQEMGGNGYSAGSGTGGALRAKVNCPTRHSDGGGHRAEVDGSDDDTGSHHKAASRERHFHYQPFEDTEPVCMSRTASASDWVVLNVGGRRIITAVATLMTDPDSMLASLCACLTRPSSAAPSQRLARRSGPAGESVHCDPTAAAADPLALHNGLNGTSLKTTAGSRANTEREERCESALTSGGGDMQSLTTTHGDTRDAERRAAGGENDATTAAAAGGAMTDALLSNNDDAAANADPTNGDGDYSSPSSDPHILLPPRRSAVPFQHHTQQLSQQQPPPPKTQSPLPSSHIPLPSPHLPPSAASSLGPPLPTVRDAGNMGATAAAAEEGDGEAVNPQQAVSAVPLDTDRYNAVLLDLDADYFMPVLNYLRHGAVMIPSYISVDGVLAMAEYLNVGGLVRRLRGPPVTRRVLLFSWGSGSNGELGTHAKRDEATPTMAQVTPFGVRVREIALGANYSCALTDSGNIYTLGNGEWGQLGLGSVLAGGRGGASTAIGNNNINSGLDQDGSGAEAPVELLIPRRIPLFEHIPAVHVAAGYAFAMAVVEDYHVYFWGNNNHGQSGRGRSFFDTHTKKVDSPVLVETLEGKRIIQLSCGSFFALALSEDGALYSWGLVDCVGLGTPEEVERRYHAVLGESLSNERRSVVLTPQLVTVKGRRRAGGTSTTITTTTTTSERIVRIRAGQWHSGAINEHGELFTWGVGYQGRLGHGSKTPAYVPTLVQGALEGQHVVDVACGSFHTVALTSSGDVFCWGDNASGQCGTTANSPDAFTAPYRVVGLEYVAGGVARSIACGRQHTVVVMEGPQPWCVLPCCQVDACGRAAHSHAQVYCFGEVTRTGNSVGGNSAVAAAAAAAGNSGPPRGSVVGPHGVPMTALNASALPSSPNHTPFSAGSATTTAAFLPSPAMMRAAMFGGRPTLAGTAGHHHPHYQLVPGLQHVDVRAVVSGLHHTFAYVEELMMDDNDDVVEGEYRGRGEVWRSRPQRPSYRKGSCVSAARGHNPSYGVPQLRADAVRRSPGGFSLFSPTTTSTTTTTDASASTPLYLRGISNGPMSFYPPNWALGMEGDASMPPPPPASASSTAAGATPRRFNAAP